MRVVSLVFGILFCSLFLQAQSLNGDWEAWSAPSTWASGCVPIDGESIRIPAGKQIILDIPSPALEELQIEGHLQVAAHEGLSLSVGRMKIEEGGRLSIGTEKKAFTSSFDLIIRDAKEAGIRVAKGGSLSLYAQKTTASASSEECPIQLWLQTAAQLRVETGAAEVVLFGVGIQGEAPFGKAPFFLDWEGPLSSGKYLVAHCQFSNLSGGAIQLDKTDGLPILDNVFYQIEGPAIQCSPSGLGKGNRLEGNLIVACQPAHLGAIQLYHPGQVIKRNKVINTRGSAAIRFDLPPKYEDFDWTEQGRRLEFAFNDLRNEVYGPIPVTGLFVADFPHTNLWTMNDNQVEGFGLGIDCRGHRLIFENTSVRNCLKGILPGGASFRKGEIVFAKTSPRASAQMAIHCQGNKRHNAPKMENIQIKGYPTDIVFEGAMEASHYFSKMTFDQSPCFQFVSVPDDQKVYFVDTELPYVKATVPACHQAADQESSDAHAHHHHAAKAEVFYLLPPRARWRHSACQQQSSGNWICPSESFGELTLSTGSGLDDPVHEHPRLFEQLEIRQAGGQWHAVGDSPSNRLHLSLASGQGYELRWANAGDLQDISCEWAAPEGKSIQLSFSHPFDRPMGIRSFGAQVMPLSSFEELSQSSQTAFWMDTKRQIAELKIVSKDLEDELVLYTFSPQTEIVQGDQTVPITMLHEADKDQVTLQYELFKSSSVKLLLADYFGNTLATLAEGNQTAGAHRIAIDLADHPLEEELHFYFLEVDGVKHKGAIYVERE